jgi:hypothetical protein
LAGWGKALSDCPLLRPKNGGLAFFSGTPYAVPVKAESPPFDDHICLFQAVEDFAVQQLIALVVAMEFRVVISFAVNQVVHRS